MSTLPDTFWRRRTVLVTGARGLVGRWLVADLGRRGARVIALQRRAAGCPCEWPSGVRIIEGNVTEAALLERVLTEHAVETIFHLAAQSQTAAAVQNPAETLEANVRGTWTVLEAARTTRTCQVIVASSAKAYDHRGEGILHEGCALGDPFPYGVSKACADLITTMYGRTFGLPAAIARCGNLYGAGDLNYSRVIPGVIRATLRGEAFRIRSSGAEVRDYVHVEDGVRGYLCLAERLAAEPRLAGEAFNFATGRRYSVLEVVEIILRTMGRTDLRPVFLGGGVAEPPYRFLSAEKARRELQWQPRIDFEAGLGDAIDWYRQYLTNADSEPRLSLAVPETRS